MNSLWLHGAFADRSSSGGAGFRNRPTCPGSGARSGSEASLGSIRRGEWADTVVATGALRPQDFLLSLYHSHQTWFPQLKGHHRRAASPIEFARFRISARLPRDRPLEGSPSCDPRTIGLDVTSSGPLGWLPG